jgi:uncharacterized membrane protein YozB (DUF420 family)
MILNVPLDYIVGTIAKVLALSVVDCGFKSQSDYNKHDKIGICCFSAWAVLKVSKIQYNKANFKS